MGGQGNINQPESMMNAPVAAPIKALSAAQETAAYEQGGSFARNRLERVAIAAAAAQTLGTDPTFEQWEAYRLQWVDGHAHQNPNASSNASDVAWSEFAKLLDTLYGLTKPKSTTAAATKKASERAAKTEALLAKHQDTPVIELRDALAKTYEAMAQNPENRELKKQQRELDQVLRLRTSEENKAHGEEIKRLRAEVREKVSKCTDIEKLEAVTEILDEYTDVAYTIED